MEQNLYPEELSIVPRSRKRRTHCKGDRSNLVLGHGCTFPLLVGVSLVHSFFPGIVPSSRKKPLQEATRNQPQKGTGSGKARPEGFLAHVPASISNQKIKGKGFAIRDVIRIESVLVGPALPPQKHIQAGSRTHGRRQKGEDHRCHHSGAGLAAAPQDLLQDHGNEANGKSAIKDPRTSQRQDRKDLCDDQIVILIGVTDALAASASSLWRVAHDCLVLMVEVVGKCCCECYWILRISIL